MFLGVVRDQGVYGIVGNYNGGERECVCAYMRRRRGASALQQYVVKTKAERRRRRWRVDLCRKVGEGGKRLRKPEWQRDGGKPVELCQRMKLRRTPIEGTRWEEERRRNEETRESKAHGCLPSVPKGRGDGVAHTRDKELFCMDPRRLRHPDVSCHAAAQSRVMVSPPTMHFCGEGGGMVSTYTSRPFSLPRTVAP